MISAESVPIKFHASPWFNHVTTNQSRPFPGGRTIPNVMRFLNETLPNWCFLNIRISIGQWHVTRSGVEQILKFWNLRWKASLLHRICEHERPFDISKSSLQLHSLFSDKFPHHIQYRKFSALQLIAPLLLFALPDGLEWKFAPISSPGNSAGLASSTPNRASDDSQPPGPGPLDQPISLATALESVSTIWRDFLLVPTLCHHAATSHLPQSFPSFSTTPSK